MKKEKETPQIVVHRQLPARFGSLANSSTLSCLSEETVTLLQERISWKKLQVPEQFGVQPDEDFENLCDMAADVFPEELFECTALPWNQKMVATLKEKMKDPDEDFLLLPYLIPALLQMRLKCAERLFEMVKVGANGKYAVELFQSGRRARVEVDSEVPHVGEEVFGLAGMAESEVMKADLWLYALIVKAAATLCKSYMALRIGQAGDALSALTGAPSMHYCHGDYVSCANTLANILLEAKKRNFLIAASQPRTRAAMEQFVPPCNSFSVLQIANTITHASQKPVDTVFLLLHNPYLSHNLFCKLFHIQDGNKHMRRHFASDVQKKIEDLKYSKT